MRPINLFEDPNNIPLANPNFGRPYVSFSHSGFESPHLITTERDFHDSILQSTGPSNDKVGELFNAIKEQTNNFDGSLEIHAEIMNAFMNNTELYEKGRKINFREFRLERYINPIFWMRAYRYPKINNTEWDGEKEHRMDFMTPIYFAKGTQLYDLYEGLEVLKSRGLKEKILLGALKENYPIDDLTILDTPSVLREPTKYQLLIAPTGFGNHLLGNTQHHNANYIILDD